MKSSLFPTVRHKAFILSFGVLFAVFLGPLIALKQTFLFGDYGVQHYPWARMAFEAVRSGRLPLWTNLMCGGFPFAAEGQAGVFYAPNFIFYKFLPFDVAYTWLIPAHMLLGGAGFYVWMRRSGRGETASAVGATAFAFGSAFAGCFYNTGSLKTLSWMPVALWLMDSARSKNGAHRVLCACGLALVISQQWTAGFSQMAIYAFLYYGLYALWSRRSLIALAASGVVGTLIASPQIVLTLELIRQSVRHGESVSFALWGSTPPPAAVAPLFPHWANLFGAALYVGILPLFVIALLPCVRRPAGWGRHAVIAVVFCLLALGKYNPLYRAFIEYSGLTLFRNPSKFLFFASFATCALAAYAWDGFVERPCGTASKRICGWVFGLAGAAAVLPGLVGFILKTFDSGLRERFHAMAEAVVAEKGFQAKDFSYYLDAANRMLDNLVAVVSYSNRLNVWVIALCLGSSVLIALFVRGRIGRRAFAATAVAVMVADFWVFGGFIGTGFIGNARPWPAETVSSGVADLLRARPKGSLFAEIGTPEFEVVEPNRNMPHGIAHAGGYSPLLLKRYYELMKDFGFLDASLGRSASDGNIWRRQVALLDIAGVGLIHSQTPLEWPGLEGVSSGSVDGYWYQNRNASPWVRGYAHWDVIPDKEKRLAFLKSDGFDPRRTVVLEADPGISEAPSDVLGDVGVMSLRGTPNGIEVHISSPGTRVLLVPIPVYPGWKFEVDGNKVKAFVANHAYHGLIVPAGGHQVRAVFEPAFLTLTLGLAWTVAGAVMVLAGLIAVGLRLRRL